MNNSLNSISGTKVWSQNILQPQYEYQINIKEPNYIFKSKLKKWYVDNK